MSNSTVIGNVSQIQRFSTGDGEGIRTTVFMQGCNLRCPWCHNPETLPMDKCTLRYTDGPEKRRTVISGVRMSADEVMKTVAEDAPFYAESGGGMTLSGGEPLLQGEFCLALCRLCAERGIDTVVDTAGDVPWNCFEAVIPFVRRFLFDMKCSSAEDYKNTVGGDFRRITDNLKRLISIGKRVTVRIPVIPDHSFGEDYAESLIPVLRDCGANEIELLPFHRLGSAKYTAIGRVYGYAGREPLSPADLAGMCRVLENAGFTASAVK